MALTPPFDQLLDSLADTLSARAGPLTFCAGSTVFEEGDRGSSAFIVESGYVEISRLSQGKRKLIAVLGPGEIFGEMAPIDGKERSATAIALHDTEVVAVEREQLERSVDSADPLTQMLLRVLLERLRNTQAPSNDGAARGSPEQEAGIPRYASACKLVSGQLKLLADLREAVDREEFKLLYQPIVGLDDGRAAGFEALVRWNRRGEGFVPPDEFIGVAENWGLIVPLGSWILEQALKALERLHWRWEKSGRGGKRPFMSINVAAGQVGTPEDVDRLITRIRRADVDPLSVKLEITEQMLVDNPAVAAAGFARFKELGVTLAIDDFGTGYSSLSYLHRFPLDTLKIDRALVSTLCHDDDGERIMRAIIGLARELAMDVVAEGIEKSEELRWLQEHQCGYGQGYLMSRPVPYEQAEDFLTRGFDWETPGQSKSRASFPGGKGAATARVAASPG